ncbi:MAG: sodium:solute symporter, partial [Ktedonobacteraceae bacterium]|nr:sodium:solute symporter [Ktedonobacteraceae bacterium]
MINGQMITVFILVFLTISMLGFLAARWRPGDLNRLHEWGLAGRRFGNIVSWFLIGGDMYTAYTFVAVPALI